MRRDEMQCSDFCYLLLRLGTYGAYTVQGLQAKLLLPFLALFSIHFYRHFNPYVNPANGCCASATQKYVSFLIFSFACGCLGIGTDRLQQDCDINVDHYIDSFSVHSVFFFV